MEVKGGNELITKMYTQVWTEALYKGGGEKCLCEGFKIMATNQLNISLLLCEDCKEKLVLISFSFCINAHEENLNLWFVKIH